MKLLRQLKVGILSVIIFYYILLLSAFAQNNFIKTNIPKVLFHGSWFAFYLSIQCGERKACKSIGCVFNERLQSAGD
jgi:hypothetical protein